MAPWICAIPPNKAPKIQEEAGVGDKCLDLYFLSLCEVHRRYLRKVTGPFRPPGEQNWTQALPSVTKEEKLLGLLVQHGVWNRLSGTLDTEV
ncbi:hypothetical protein G4228_009547 [Cervus hanglu yarkandensis]|nr:hypothetical protein G4228_009547 [Cervus hanglu yarkandensis]